MKFRTLAAAAATLVGIATATPAQALVVNYNGVNINMGTIDIGQTGTIFENLALYPLINDDLGVALAFGYMPTNSMIKFTYTFTGLLNNPTNALTSSISYNYLLGGKTYKGFSNGDSLISSGPFGPGVISQGGSINGNSTGPAGVSQVFATAALPNLTNGNTSVANYAKGQQEFNTVLLGYFNTSPPGTVTITYNVTGLPLPASLPMMLLAIGGLFGFAHINKQRKALA